MTKEELYDVMNANMGFHLATTCDGKPYVRGMFLFRADENGIIFHTNKDKEVYSQLKANPNVELCFNSPEMQVRVAGVAEEITSDAILEEIKAHPTRQFMQKWKEMGINPEIGVFCVKEGVACTWTMMTNFDPKEYIQL